MRSVAAPLNVIHILAPYFYTYQWLSNCEWQSGEVERAQPVMDEKVDKPKSKHFYGLFGLVFTWLASRLLGVYVSRGDMCRRILVGKRS